MPKLGAEKHTMLDLYLGSREIRENMKEDA
jgi:hypothetical protein